MRTYHGIWPIMAMAPSCRVWSCSFSRSGASIFAVRVVGAGPRRLRSPRTRRTRWCSARTSPAELWVLLAGCRASLAKSGCWIRGVAGVSSLDAELVVCVLQVPVDALGGSCARAAVSFRLSRVRSRVRQVCVLFTLWTVRESLTRLSTSDPTCMVCPAQSRLHDLR